MPKVSVIIPTYNRANLIGRAINSVLNQTYRDFEVIVVDDASTDNTLGVIEQIKDDRIKVIKHKLNAGAAISRNTGVNASKGDYIAFLDDDDIWQPTKIEKHIRVFQISGPNVGVVYSSLKQLVGGTEKLIPDARVKKKEGYILKELLKGNFIGTPASVIRKGCLEKSGGFDESLPKFQDWELWLRIARCYEFKYIPEPLLISYYSPGGVSYQSPAVKTETMKYIIDKHKDLFEKEKRVLSGHYYYMGNLLNAAGRNNDGVRYYMKSVKSYPFQIKPLIKIIAAVFSAKNLHE